MIKAKKNNSKDLPNQRSEPGDIFLIQMITGCGSLDDTGNPAGVF
jgi:hypothetical protein